MQKLYLKTNWNMQKEMCDLYHIYHRRKQTILVAFVCQHMVELPWTKNFYKVPTFIGRFHRVRVAKQDVLSSCSLVAQWGSHKRPGGAQNGCIFPKLCYICPIENSCWQSEWIPKWVCKHHPKEFLCWWQNQKKTVNTVAQATCLHQHLTDLCAKGGLNKWVSNHYSILAIIP